MPGSLRLGKMAGIDVYVHPSWFIVLLLLTWSLASGWFAQAFAGWSTSTSWITALISALLLFVCVLWPTRWRRGSASTTSKERAWGRSRYASLAISWWSEG